MAAKKSSQNGAGCLILFALPFAGVGVFMLGLALWDIMASWTMRSWEATPAVILEAKLKTHQGGGRNHSDSYKVTARYEYIYHGRSYTGTRVAIDSGSDNISSFQQKINRELQQYKRSRNPFRCFVNPQNPAEAILYRDIRWEMVGFKSIFGLVFGGVGIGMLVGGIVAMRRAKRKNLLAAEHPSEPWLCNPAWADGKIRSSLKTTTMGLILFTVLWNVVSWPMGILFLTRKAGNTHPLEWFVVVFPAIGVILLIAVAVALLRLYKYGQSIFEMASVPGVIGGQIAGVIRVSKKVFAEDGFLVALRCVEQVTTGSGEDSEMREVVLWESEQKIDRELHQIDPDKTAIPVLFDIPYSCRPSDNSDSQKQIIWRLEAKAATPGLDYSATFDVPVFKTAESEPDVPAEKDKIAEYVVPANPEAEIRKAGVALTPLLGGGCRFVFPACRQPGTAIALSLFSIVLLSVPFIMYFGDAGWFFSCIFAVPFCGIGFLLFLFCLQLWFYSSECEISHRGIVVISGLIGMRRTRNIAAADIVKFDLKSELSSEYGTSRKVYYNVIVALTSGDEITLGKNVPGKLAADAIVYTVTQALKKEA